MGLSACCRSLWSCRVRAWSASHSDAGIDFRTLEFKDQAKEAAFAASSARGLETFFLRIGLVYAAVMCIWIGSGDYSESSYESKAEYEVQMKLLLSDVGSLCNALLLASAGVLRRTCNARVMECSIAFVFILCLVNAPFSERPFLVTVLGLEPPAGQHEKEISGLWLSLYIDCMVTIISLSPIRWSSAWPTYVIAFFASPVIHTLLSSRFVPLDMLRFSGMTLEGLIVCAAIGKRSIEFQDRRLFVMVIHERTMRAQSEFVLEECTQFARQRRGMQSNPSAGRVSHSNMSISTSKVFDVSDGSQNAKAALMRVKMAAQREQWLIDPAAVSVFVSQMIGVGSFGAVFRGLLRSMPVALKFSLELAGGEEEAHAPTLITELRVLRKLRHPNIVTFYGAIVDPPSLGMALVMELVTGCNLDAFVKRCKFIGLQIPETDFYRLTCGIARALHYLHSHDPAIVHGDMKPENILVEIFDGAPPKAKLADFGLSRILSATARGFGGTLAWMAPELMQKKKWHSTPLDVYGLGQLIHFMLSGRTPFSDCSRDAIIAALKDGLVPMSECPDDISETLTAMWHTGASCIAVDPVKRPSMAATCKQLQRCVASCGAQNELDAVARDIWCVYECTDELKDADGACIDASRGGQCGEAVDGPPTPASWHAALQCLKNSSGTHTSTEASAEIADHDKELRDVVFEAPKDCTASLDGLNGCSTMLEQDHWSVGSQFVEQEGEAASPGMHRHSSGREVLQDHPMLVAL